MKISNETKNTIKLYLTVIVYVFFLSFIIWFATSLSSCSNQTISASTTATDSEAQVLTLKTKVVYQEQLIEAYRRILHEVWLDKPSYVEDVLVESDAFDELYCLEGDSVNTSCFRFRNKMDSVRYENNSRLW